MNQNYLFGISSKIFVLTLCLIALSSFVVMLHFGFNQLTLFALLFTWVLLVLAAIDFEQQLLPDMLTLPLLLLGLLINSAGVFCSPSAAIIGACVGYVSLRLLAEIFFRITGKIGMGQGDFKLYAALGAWLGWRPLPFVILLAATVGLVVSIVLIKTKRMKQDATIPFGPYLALAGWITLLWCPNMTSFANF